MKTIPTEVDQGSTRSEERLVIDTAPTLIHTALPDGSLDFFNRRRLSAPTVDNPENFRLRDQRQGMCPLINPAERPGLRHRNLSRQNFFG
jgi:hypothetical protein